MERDHFPGTKESIYRIHETRDGLFASEFLLLG